MAIPIFPHFPKPEFLLCHELAKRWGDSLGTILQYGAFNGLPFIVFLSEPLVDRDGKWVSNLSGLCPVKDDEVREIMANGEVEIDTTLLLARNKNFEKVLEREDLGGNSFAFKNYAQKSKSLITSAELGCLWRDIECFESNLKAPVLNWLDSDPAFVTDGQLREAFQGTHEEWKELFAKLENDILHDRLSAEIAVKQESGFKVIDSLKDRLDISNGWLRDGWVGYIIRTADAAAWFKGRYEIPADSMLGRLFAEALVPCLQKDVANKESANKSKGFTQRAAIDALSAYVKDDSKLKGLFSNASRYPDLQACKVDAGGWDLVLLFGFLARRGHLKSEYTTQAGENAFKKSLGIS